jgi:hypothetical protein
MVKLRKMEEMEDGNYLKAKISLKTLYKRQ